MDSGKPPTVYGYARISTNEEVQENSLDVQADKIKDYVRYKFSGEPIVSGDIFRDTSSGEIRIFQRPEGKELNRRLEPGDHLVTAKLDRMFRSMVDAVLTVEELNLRNIHMHFLDLSVDTSSVMGLTFLHMAAAFADLERRRIGERTLETMAHLRKNKQPVNNKRPYGWDLQTIDGEKKFVPNQGERELAEWFATGYDSGEKVTWQNLADHVGRLGYRRVNGSAWDRHAVRRAYLAYKKGYPLYRDEESRKATKRNRDRKKKGG